MNESLIPYLAGYFDGEGCITLSKTSPIAKITSSDEIVLKLFKATFGGRLGTDNRRLPTGEVRKYFRWAICGPSLQSALAQMMPYLLVKKTRAERVCAMGFQHRNHKMSDAERVLRRQLRSPE